MSDPARRTDATIDAGRACAEAMTNLAKALTNFATVYRQVQARTNAQVAAARVERRQRARAAGDPGA